LTFKIKFAFRKTFLITFNHHKYNFLILIWTLKEILKETLFKDFLNLWIIILGFKLVVTVIWLFVFILGGHSFWCLGLVLLWAFIIFIIFRFFSRFLFSRFFIRISFIIAILLLNGLVIFILLFLRLILFIRNLISWSFFHICLILLWTWCFTTVFVILNLILGNTETLVRLFCVKLFWWTLFWNISINSTSCCNFISFI
jgi:hypothetical protein